MLRASVVLQAVWYLYPCNNGLVDWVLTRHVGLKPDLQGVAHKCRQECSTTLGACRTSLVTHLLCDMTIIQENKIYNIINDLFEGKT